MNQVRRPLNASSQSFRAALALMSMAFGSEIANSQEVEQSDEAWLNSLFGIEQDNAQSAVMASESEEDELTELDLLAAFDQLNAWTVEASLGSGVGMKRNALYSSGAGVDSLFGQLELDLFALKPALGRRPGFVGLLYVDYRYFDDVPDLTDEHLVVGHVQAESALWEGGKGTLGLEGIASKQALDASMEDFEVEALAVRMWRPELKVSLEQDVAEFGRVSGLAAGGRSRYDASSENYDEFAWGLEWSRELFSRWQLVMGWQRYEEDYAKRLARFGSGSAVGEETLLELEGNRWEVDVAFAPADGSLKRCRTRLLYRSEDDQEGEYYERSQWEIRQSLEWQWGDWSAKAAAAYGDLAYAERTASFLDPTPRADRSIRWTTEVSRAIGNRLRAFARAEWIDKASNASRYSYETSSVMIGISLSKTDVE